VFCAIMEFRVPGDGDGGLVIHTQGGGGGLSQCLFSLGLVRAPTTGDAVTANEEFEWSGSRDLVFMHVHDDYLTTTRQCTKRKTLDGQGRGGA